MKTEIKKVVTVTITFTEDEARWLKAYAQNWLGNGVESSDSAKIRETIFNSLEEIRL